MQIRISYTVPNSEYKRTIEDLFNTSLTDQEAGGFIYNKECTVDKGIVFSDPRRTIKEAIDVPQTITFLLGIGTGIGIGVTSNVVSSILISKLKNCSWLKIGDQTPKLTLDDIRKVIQEELEKQKNNSD
ncbi:MAG: hypothetical protein OER78_00715 [Nitrosopumilus sp.]|nr:hypothetical protein [Nitrosopumilus sp.]MDH3855648.1 hypothetical protein [Nitrosopumilus sp.]